MPLRRRLLVAVVPALAAALGASAAGAAVAPPQAALTIAPVAAPSPIASFGGHLVFSRPAAGGGFELVQRTGGGPVTPVGVPTRTVPFDVDLGPTAGGRVLATYSRCAHEPAASTFGTPAYEAATGCDVYEVDLAGGPERLVRAASSPTASEVWPSYWKGRLAFARTYDAKPGLPYLYVKALASSAPSVRAPGGPRQVCARGSGGRRVCSDPRRSVPEALDLYGRRLAFAWRYADLAEGPAYDLRVDDLAAGTGRVLDHAGGGGLTAIVLGWPSFEAGRLFWSRACFGDPSGCPNRRRLVASTYLGSPAESDADAPDQVLSAERDGGTTVLETDASAVADCQGDPPTPSGTCAITVRTPEYLPRG